MTSMNVVGCNDLFKMLLLVAATVVSCSIDNDPESAGEMHLRNDLQAESVKFSQAGTPTSGTMPKIRHQWQVVIINSKVLKHVMGDEKRVLEKCNEIKERLLANKDVAILPADTLRIVLIQSSNFLIFHSTHHKTITFALP